MFEVIEEKGAKYVFTRPGNKPKSLLCANTGFSVNNLARM